jgi:putative transcriptional regulator
MAIVINLDLMLAKRKVKSRELAAYVGITEQNLSLLKSGKVKGIRFATLEKICERLDCQPGDILEWTGDTQEEAGDDANASSPW